MIMSNNNKSSWVQRVKVKTKIAIPMGVNLTSGETVALADIQEKSVARMSKDRNELTTAITNVDKSKDLDSAISTALSSVNIARRTYRMTKNPIKKREWARRLIIADRTVKSLRDVKKRMTATSERLRMIRGDLELQIAEAKATAAETRAYATAGKQLKLAGEKLIDARSVANGMKLEYKSLEISMESIEKEISNIDKDSVIEQAEKLLSGATQ